MLANYYLTNLKSKQMKKITFLTLTVILFSCQKQKEVRQTEQQQTIKVSFANSSPLILTGSLTDLGTYKQFILLDISGKELLSYRVEGSKMKDFTIAEGLDSKPLWACVKAKGNACTYDVACVLLCSSVAAVTCHLIWISQCMSEKPQITFQPIVIKSQFDSTIKFNP